MLRLIASALLMLIPGTASAAIFVDDDRVTLRADRDLAPVGTVTGGLHVVYGSGFLIDECTVLTARHVGGSIDNILGTPLSFKAANLASVGIVVAAGQSDPGSSEQRSLDRDWMVIRLKHCLGRRLGFFHLSSAAALYAGNRVIKVESAGYPRDRLVSAGVTIDPDCRVFWVARGQMGHDCATLPGNSGGPLLVRRGDSLLAVGINAAGWDRARPEPFRANDANLAIDVGYIANAICRVIAKPNNVFCQ